ncbi:MAG: hypothetical protein JXA97_03235 [Anaerolineales bacterium]|nr:hypothetical protein [Anaerolineales bacterium]
MGTSVGYQIADRIVSGVYKADAYKPANAGEHWPIAERKTAFFRERDLQLLPMLQNLDMLPPATIVLGRVRNGNPVLLTLGLSPVGHLVITGPRNSGKSELIRSALLSLCLTSRQAQVCILGVDIGGHELAVLDALPHALTDLATEPNYARALFVWLEEERQRRAAYHIQRPAICLVLDDLAWLDRPARKAEARLLTGLIENGAASGIHVIAASLDPLPVRFHACLDRNNVAHATTFNHHSGAFTLKWGEESIQASAAWSSAGDLNTAVALVGAGWMVSRRYLARADGN